MYPIVEATPFGEIGAAAGSGQGTGGEPILDHFQWHSPGTGGDGPGRPSVEASPSPVGPGPNSEDENDLYADSSDEGETEEPTMPPARPGRTWPEGAFATPAVVPAELRQLGPSPSVSDAFLAMLLQDREQAPRDEGEPDDPAEAHGAADEHAAEQAALAAFVPPPGHHSGIAQ